MLVAFDTTFLNALFNANSGVAAYRADVRKLVTEIGDNNGFIIIPMPVWAELLIGLRLYSDTQAYDNAIAEVQSSHFIEVIPFGEKAAGILVDVTCDAIIAGDKKGGGDNWRKVTFDRQIVAIAKAEGAAILYTADKDQARFADNEFGLKVRDLESLGKT